MGLPDRVEHPAVLLELLPGAEQRQPVGERGGRHRVDTGGLLRALRREPRPRGRVRVVAQDPPRDRLTFDTVHHEPGAETVGRFEHEPHRGGEHTGVMGGTEDVGFGGPVERAAHCRARIPAEDQREVIVGDVRVERPRLPRRAPREATQRIDGCVRAE